MSKFIQKPPGIEMAPPDAESIRSRFLSKFVEEGKRHVPFWFSFPLTPIGKDFFSRPEFLSLRQVFFMVGKGKRIFQTQPGDVQRFFLNQKPVEDFDLYVFDESCSWCIASTHEMSPNAQNDSDFLLLAAGNPPGGVPTQDFEPR